MERPGPWATPWRTWREILPATWKEASADNIGLAAAGVAFYGFLALVPLLSAIALTYGIFAEPHTVIRHMHALMSVMPADIARGVGEQMMTVVKGSDERKGLGVLIAIGIALFGGFRDQGNLTPFDDEFSENYASGTGNTEEEAIEALKKDIAGTAESIWAI